MNRLLVALVLACLFFLTACPGQKIQLILMERRIELIPERKMSEMRGFLKGISTDPGREEDRI